MGAGLRFERTSGPSGFMEISCACTLIATPNVRATTGVVAGPLSSKLKTASTAAIVKFNSLTCRITFSFAKDPVRPCHWAAVELLYPWALFRFFKKHSTQYLMTCLAWPIRLRPAETEMRLPERVSTIAPMRSPVATAGQWTTSWPLRYGGVVHGASRKDNHEKI